ncbi:16019_t:CDS:2, partial [Funneliformis geosporum]
SDIYSFYMIMWEFIYGIPPFNNEAHDFQLSLNICKGKRPEIIKNIQQCYINLMKRCWDIDPLKRLTASEIKEIIKEMGTASTRTQDMFTEILLYYKQHA